MTLKIIELEKLKKEAEIVELKAKPIGQLKCFWCERKEIGRLNNWVVGDSTIPISPFILENREGKIKYYQCIYHNTIFCEKCIKNDFQSAPKYNEAARCIPNTPHQDCIYEMHEINIKDKEVGEKEQAAINKEEEKERAALAKIWDNWADYEEEYTSKGKSGKYAFAKEKAAELVNNELNKTVSGA